MALNKTKGKLKGDGIPNLGNIGNALTVQTEKRENRQAVEAQTLVERQRLAQDARKKALHLNDQARAVNDETRDQQLDILSGMTSQLDKARTAMRLADSDNPLDRMSLWFLQQQDAGYTREGNLERLGYLQSAAGLIGDVGAIRQGEFADEIARTQEMLDIELATNDDRFAVVKLAEIQGQELIDAEVQAQNTRLGVMQNQVSMQNHALLNTTDDQIILAAQQAAKSPTQSTNIGGVEISLARLQTRVKEVEQLRHNEQVMRVNAADMALEQLTMPELLALEATAQGSKKRSAPVGNTNVPLGRITDRIYEMNNRAVGAAQSQFALTQIQEKVIGKAQQNALDAMLLPQLESIIQNGFVDPSTGIKYDSTMVRAASEQKYNDDLRSAQMQSTVATLTNPAAQTASLQQQVTQILGNLPPGSPASTQLTTSISGLAHATHLLNSGNPALMGEGYRLIQTAQESINNVVNSEAKRLAMGDSAKEAALKFSLTGQQIPPDLIRSELMSRVKKGMDAGSWLTPEQNAVFVSTYRQAKYNLAAENQTQGIQLSTEDIESQAAELAMNEVLNSISAPMSAQIMGMQASKQAAPNNPVNGVMTQGEFTATLINADQLGMEAYLRVAQPDKETEAKIRAGALIPPELQQAQNARLYMALEQKKAGLGDAYSAWWSSGDPSKMVDMYTTSQMQAAKGDFTKMTQLSLVMPLMHDAMSAYGVALENGKQAAYAQEIAKEHVSYVTFGGNPQTKQVFVLEQTPGLSTQEKQIGMQQIITPILATITANGITDPAQITLEIESALQVFEPQTSQGRAVLGKILKGRDAALKIVDDFASLNSGLGPHANSILGAQLGMGGIDWSMSQSGKQLVEDHLAPSLSRGTINSNFGWFTDLGKSGVQSTTVPTNRGME